MDGENMLLDDTRLDDTRLDNTRQDDARFDDTRLDDTQPDDTCLDEVRLDDTLPDDTLPDDTLLDDTLSDDTCLDEVRLDKAKLEGIIESILFVSGDPISFSELARVFEMDESAIRTVISEMAERMKREQKGIFPFIANDTVQFVTNPDYQSWLVRCFAPPEERILSKSLMETLSVIAYRQPVTRAEIEAIRGVRCEYAVSQLLKQGFIYEAGRKDCIGRPAMFATTNSFLRRFALRSIDELPPLPLTEDETEEGEQIAAQIQIYE